MARLPKWPKQPKATSSLEVWTRYKSKVAEIKKKRIAIKAAPNKKRAIAEAARKLKT